MMWFALCNDANTRPSHRNHGNGSMN